MFPDPHYLPALGGKLEIGLQISSGVCFELAAPPHRVGLGERPVLRTAMPEPMKAMSTVRRLPTTMTFAR
jgi:hypothetical protein